MKPVIKAIIAGTLAITIYLGVVVVTTPALPPSDAINAALQLNSIVIGGTGIGIGLQIFLSEKSKMLGCRIDEKNVLGNSGSTAATSFFSFFSLVPLGCCGWWLYMLSLLPSIVGTGISVVLIEYSQALAYLGLVVVFSFVGLGAYKLQKEIKARKLQTL